MKKGSKRGLRRLGSDSDKSGGDKSSEDSSDKKKSSDSEVEQKKYNSNIKNIY